MIEVGSHFDTNNGLEVNPVIRLQTLNGIYAELKKLPSFFRCLDKTLRFYSQDSSNPKIFHF